MPKAETERFDASGVIAVGEAESIFGILRPIRRLDSMPCRSDVRNRDFGDRSYFRWLQNDEASCANGGTAACGGKLRQRP